MECSRNNTSSERVSDDKKATEQLNTHRCCSSCVVAAGNDAVTSLDNRSNNKRLTHNTQPDTVQVKVLFGIHDDLAPADMQ